VTKFTGKSNTPFVSIVWHPPMFAY